MSTDRDVTRIVRSWLDEGVTVLPDRILDEVLDQLPATPQRRAGWLARRSPLVSSNVVRVALAAAAVVVIAVVGYNLLPGLGTVGPGATPAPSPTLLARGNFVTVRGAVELEAVVDGSTVTGRLTVSDDGGFFTVDLQCARTTEDGLIMIGGYTVDADASGSGLSPVGTLAAIVLKRGSPVQATVWSQRGGGTGATSCPGYLDERFDEKLMDGRLDDDDPGPIVGTVEFGP